MLESRETEVKNDLKADINDLKADIKEVKDEIRSTKSELRKELKEKQSSLKWFIGIFVTASVVVTSVIVTLITLFIK